MITWYPGHMAKAKRQLTEQLSRVNVVIELCDARIPLSSRNPDLNTLCAHKQRILLLNKSDLADGQTTAQWLKYFSNEGLTALPLEASKKQSVKQVVPAIKRAAADVLERARDRGFSKTIRCMVIGVPNVGKSTLINTLAGRAPLKTEDRPGVTRATQWVKIDPYLELMDTPGMLWPKLEDKKAARRLAYIAAIRDQVLDVYALCISLLNELMEIAPQAVCERYKVTDASLRGQELLEAICRGRGFLLPGAACDLDRAVTTVLNEFRDGRIARLSLETPPQNAHDK